MCPACDFAGVYPGRAMQVPWSVLRHGAGSVSLVWEQNSVPLPRGAQAGPGNVFLAASTSSCLEMAAKWQQAPIQPQGFERRRLNCGLEGCLHSSLVALRSSLTLATAHTKTRSARARPGLRGREQWAWLGILRCLIKVVLCVPRSTPGSPRAVPGGSNAAGN